MIFRSSSKPNLTGMLHHLIDLQCFKKFSMNAQSDRQIDRQK